MQLGLGLGVISAAVGGKASGDSDPNYANVSLLLHLDGANGSTTFTDNSPTPKTITRAGGTVISTSQSKFGGASAAFSVAGDGLNTASNTAFDFASGDFTIELWHRPNSVTSGATQVLIDRGLFSGFTPWAITQFNASLRLACSANGSSWLVDLFSASVLSANTWHHVAATRNGNDWRLFCNGTQIATANASGTLPTTATAVTIGRQNGGGGQFAGFLDEIRVTKGVARYTSNFTIPAAAFPNS